MHFRNGPGTLPRTVLSTLAVLCLLLTLPVRSARAGDEFEQRVLPLIRTHCFDCHGGGEASGSIDLESYSTVDDVVGDVEVWETIAHVIAGGEMPPEDSDEMSEDEKRQIVNFCHQVMDRVNAAGQTDLEPTSPRRLTRREYVNTVRDLLGVTIDAETFLPEDKVGATGFRNDATELMVPAELLEKYLMLADKIVTEAFEGENPPAASRLIRVRPSEAVSDKAAATQIIKSFGKRAFRRPLTPREIEQYLTLFRQMQSAGSDFEYGIRTVAKAMLVSPHFLFRIEAVLPSEGVTAINDYELASRLSYLLWSSAPDERLLDLADAGTLSQPDVLTEEVHRMLADERAQTLAEEFAEQWLFSRLTSREPDVVAFPNYTSKLDEASKEELQRFITHLFREDRSLIDLIDADYTFVNGVLARHYEMSIESDTPWHRVPLLPEHHRGGLLGMARVLQRTSMSDRTSPTVRGAWVLDALLGTPPPPPPPDVNNTIDQSNSGTERALTFREKLALHANDGSACASCHKKMDPIGFAMDNYDAIGQWRTKWREMPIDTSGTMNDGRTLQGIEDLKQLLLDRKQQFVRNLTRKFLVYALGRELTGNDFPTVNAIVQQVAEQEFRASSLVIAVVHSFPFKHKKHPSSLAANL